MNEDYSIIEQRSACGDDIEIDRKQAYRYMGYKSGADDEIFESLYNECLIQFEQTVNYKACFRKAKISIDGNVIDFGFSKVESEKLRINLTGCDYVYIFAATTGISVDSLMNRESKISPSKSMIIDCIGSSAIECWCDAVNDEMKDKYLTRPRFSPGYGDLALDFQKDIVNFLDTGRKIGLTLTDELFMCPIKSVTAIVGIMGEKQ